MANERRASRRWSTSDYVRFSEDIGEVAEREDAMQREIDSYLRHLRTAGFDSPAIFTEDEDEGRT